MSQRNSGHRWRVATAVAIGACLITSLAPGLAAAAPAGDPAIVHTDAGPVHGTVTATERTFQGIPYAAPPVGARRWASPQPAAPWTSVRDATRPGANCAQLPGEFGEPASGSEDCLYLNVTTPRNTAGRRLPVMVWLHGGGYRDGAGAMYRPTKLVDQGDVIVVTVNYRLGVFGFLDHPALDGGPDTAHGSGDFGLEDQQAALRWVRRNAAAFGGDAGNVTLFGESAGGMSTCSQLVSPQAAGLFQRAVIQSGPCASGIWPGPDGSPDPTGVWLARSAALARQQGLAVAAQLGCADPATAATCLRALPTAALLPQSDYGFGPVYGAGKLLPESPESALAAGRVNRVPVVDGINSDEYRTFVAGYELLGQPPMTAADYTTQVTKFVGAGHAAATLARYPLAHYGSPSEAWAAVVTDAVLARSQSEAGADLARVVPTYTYEFADPHAPWFTAAAKPSFPTGAFHAAELQYLFDTDYFTGATLTPAQQRLSDQMVRYWTNFAHTGNPNGPGVPGWPATGTAGTWAQQLAPGRGGSHPIDFGRAHNDEFWRTIDR